METSKSLKVMKKYEYFFFISYIIQYWNTSIKFFKKFEKKINLKKKLKKKIIGPPGR